ncbi:MAG: WYL domain-containing protein [Prevotella sp.]|nr:WYL domain-containing protein [Prevotella sp.]
MRHDKLEKQLELMLLLTENRQYTVAQLCDRLDISRRNLYYYLEFFRDYGFRVEKRSGACYSLDKDSDFFRRLFRTVNFTEDEAIVMRRILERANDNSLQVQHLRRKLDALYDLDILDDVELRQRYAQSVSVIYDAIKWRRCVVLRHYSSPHSNTQTDRIVEPYMFLNHNNEIRAFELKTRMNKTFKLARMESVELLADEWQNEKHHKRVFTDIFLFSGEQQMPVKLRLGRLAYNLMVEEYPRSQPYIVKEDSRHWLLELDVCSYIGIGRFVLGLYDDVEVLGDEGFKTYLRDRIGKMQT